MGNSISSSNSTMCVNKENENELGIKVIRKKFVQVIVNYIRFLKTIGRRIVRSPANDIEREKRKYNDVRKELLDFVFEHRTYFTVKEIKLLSKHGSILHTLSFDYSDNFEHFLNLDDISELFNDVSELNNFFQVMSSVDCVVDHVKEEIIRKIKVALKKSVISNEDIQLFIETDFLVDKNVLKNNCSSYIELKPYIRSRQISYMCRIVSTEHINKIAFKFQGSIKDYEDEKSCCVCLEDYETDQEVCQLPCNHFCCRKCTEEMFVNPKRTFINENGVKANFQCPICRGDCT